MSGTVTDAVMVLLAIEIAVLHILIARKMDWFKFGYRATPD